MVFVTLFDLIGDYEDQAAIGKIKSGSEACNCWKFLAIFLLFIAGDLTQWYT